MSSKTKIVVLHMKELIYTGIIVVLGILLILLLITMLSPDKNNSGSRTSSSDSMVQEIGTDAVSNYIPGVYTTQLVLSGQAVDVEVIVEQDSITSIRLNNLDESVTTMYPLLEPTFHTICEQIYETQSLENITYTADSKYTSLVLLEAIRNSLEKATASTTDDTTVY